MEQLGAYKKDIEDEVEENFFYKCSVDNKYYVSINPEKIRKKNPSFKNIWVLKQKGENFPDMGNGKKLYRENKIGSEEALEAYSKKKGIDVTNLDSSIEDSKLTPSEKNILAKHILNCESDRELLDIIYELVDYDGKLFDKAMDIYEEEGSVAYRVKKISDLF